MQRRERGRLIVHAKRCQACQACMVVCSLVHEGQSIPSLARIRVAVDPFTGDHQISYCRQCKRAPCALACPQNAIERDGDGGFWRVAADLCDGCGACVAACPFGAIVLHHRGAPALMCDLCGGQPECVASCPSGALTWVIKDTQS